MNNRHSSGCIETMRVSDGSIPLIDYHIDRLTLSVAQLWEQILHAEAWVSQLMEYIGTHELKTCVLRCHTYFDMNVCTLVHTFTHRPIPEPMEECLIGLHPAIQLPIAADRWIKLADRHIYTQAMDYARAHQLNDVILCNNKGHICETTISNIILRYGDLYKTPSLDEGPVKGVFLSYLMDTSDWNIISTSISLETLVAADDIWLCNAVRGLYKATLIQDAPQ